jgi:hypothetical protein
LPSVVRPPSGGCCLRSTERRGRHDAGTAGGPRYRPYRGAGPLRSERSVWPGGCSGLVCALPGRLRPDRIRWLAARHPGFGFGFGLGLGLGEYSSRSWRWRCPWGHSVAPPPSRFPPVEPAPVMSAEACEHSQRLDGSAPLGTRQRVVLLPHAQIEPLASDPPPPAPGRPQA